MVTSNTLRIEQVSADVWNAHLGNMAKVDTINLYVNYTPGDETHIELTYYIKDNFINKQALVCYKDENGFIIPKIDKIQQLINGVIPVTIPLGTDSFMIRIEYIGVISNRGTLDVDIRFEGEEY